jgi:hypothetical protein
MRSSLLCASAALAAGLVLSACSSGAGSSSAVPSSAMPSSSGHVIVMGKSHGHTYKVRLAPGVKPMTIGCDYSVYAFCFYVQPNNPGPYVETSTAPSYQLENDGWIVANASRRGKVDRKFSDYFSPDPGNPTYQYITYTGADPRRDKPVKFTDYYCIGFAPSTDCNGTYGNYTFKLGIAIEP